MTDKPNCYKCEWRDEAPGSAHSTCGHLKAGGKDAGQNAFAILASVGRGTPVIDAHGAVALNIRANAHGIRSGWFNWPFNFDPTWLESCDGFKAKETPTAPLSTPTEASR